MLDPESWRPEPGKPVTLVRNERYWGPTPSFNRLIWNVIENPTARTRRRSATGTRIRMAEQAVGLLRNNSIRC